MFAPLTGGSLSPSSFLMAALVSGCVCAGAAILRKLQPGFDERQLVEVLRSDQDDRPIFLVYQLRKLNAITPCSGKLSCVPFGEPSMVRFLVDIGPCSTNYWVVCEGSLGYGCNVVAVLRFSDEDLVYHYELVKSCQ